jgi:hypothetical protein
MPWGRQNSDFQEWSDLMATSDKSDVGRTGSARLRKQIGRPEGFGPSDGGASFTFALPQASGNRGEAT